MNWGAALGRLAVYSTALAFLTAPSLIVKLVGLVVLGIALINEFH